MKVHPTNWTHPYWSDGYPQEIHHHCKGSTNHDQCHYQLSDHPKCGLSQMGRRREEQEKEQGEEGRGERSGRRERERERERRREGGAGN